jgi:hypothetical protein
MLHIYGEDLGVLKGNPTRKNLENISVDTTITLLQKKHIVMSIDLMYFTGIPFLITVSQNILFLTATSLQDRKKGVIMKAIQQVFRVLPRMRTYSGGIRIY